MFCRNCGRELAAGMKFCPGCGTPADAAASPAGSMTADVRSAGTVAKRPITQGRLGEAEVRKGEEQAVIDRVLQTTGVVPSETAVLVNKYSPKYFASDARSGQLLVINLKNTVYTCIPFERVVGGQFMSEDDSAGATAGFLAFGIVGGLIAGNRVGNNRYRIFHDDENLPPIDIGFLNGAPVKRNSDEFNSVVEFSGKVDNMVRAAAASAGRM